MLYRINIIITINCKNKNPILKLMKKEMLIMFAYCVIKFNYCNIQRINKFTVKTKILVYNRLIHIKN